MTTTGLPEPRIVVWQPAPDCDCDCYWVSDTHTRLCLGRYGTRREAQAAASRARHATKPTAAMNELTASA